MSLSSFFIVGLGGFLGAMARYGVGMWVGQRWGRSFPLGTLVVNVTGCFFIGLVMQVATDRLLLSPQWRLFLVIGFLGAYTTFSAFEFETGALLADGEMLYALMNVAVSVIAGFAALKLGQTAAGML